MNIYLNEKLIRQNVNDISCYHIKEHMKGVFGLDEREYYLMCNGKLLQNNDDIISQDVHAYLRLFGGKGGFGSMLRAIGAQIEKTTNREACRDLSGRRLRDINEEKRLKTWLEQQKEREEEMEDKKKKKLEKMLSQPKHEFKDEAYEQARSELTQTVGDAVEQGFRKAEEIEGKSTSMKRKLEETTDKKKKKKKTNALWLGADDLSSSSDTDSDSVDSSSNSVSSSSSKSQKNPETQSSEESVDK